MESAMIRIHSSPALHLSNNGAKVSKYARSSIIFFHNNNKNNTLNNHNQTSLCASEFATLLHPVFRTRSSSFRHANCVPERSSLGPPAPPSNNGNKGRVLMRGMRGVSLVLACVLGLLNLNSNMNPMFKEAYAENPFGGVPAGAGKMAVATLLETTIKAKRTTKNPGVSRGRVNVKEHKWYAIGQSINGNKNAEKILEKINTQGDQEFEVQMARVELLILQEKFAEAKNILEIIIKNKFGSNQDGKGIIEKLNNEGSSLLEQYHAAQLILYKAIVLTMQNQNEEAAKWWKDFGDILSLDPMSFNFPL